tara:strand:- start:11645 stop:12469 length:825 start_codon:yes stop_codon:yes gene_type:complete
LSRNQDRLGGVQQPDTSPPPQQGGGGFSFVVPTEFVDLPSQGRFYPEGHPLHGQDSIEIKQMTAKEEDILTSRTLLKKGVALERLISSLIVDNTIDPRTLLIGDRNAIIVAARVSGYGSDYSTKVQCPACDTKQTYTFNLYSAHVYHGEDNENLRATINANGTITCRLPKTQVEVVAKLLTGRDEKSITSIVKSDNQISKQLETLIVSVNGDSSREAIKYVANNIPSMDSRHLRMAIKKATPNIDLTQEFSCTECGHTQEMEVPLTADFFWPDR